MTKSKYQAVLFDFDGTLAETMDDMCRAWQNSFRDYGVEIKPGDYLELEGMQVQKVAETLCEKYSVPKPWPSDIVSKKEDYYRKSNRFRFYPGAHELVAKLKEHGINVGLVTASSTERLVSSVEESFLGQFDVVITGDTTERGKPFPDPYLRAANQLHLKPGSCVVVENAPLGIQSAKAAGMQCIAVSSTVAKDKLGQADVLIDNLAHLNSQVDELILT